MIKCAIIGLGRIGSTLEDDAKREKPASHAGCISNNSETVLEAGCDVDTEKCSNFRKRWNCNSVYNSPDEMLTNHNIDILHIATPPETHLEIIKKALNAEIPVIILEKPVAHTKEQAIQIADLCRLSSSKVIVNHERRYSLQYRRVHNVISNNIYGKLLSINTKLYMGRTRKIPSILYDDGTHMIDLINFLTQSKMEISNVSAEEFTLITSAKSNRIPIVIECGRGRDHLVFELDFSFETGRIIAGNGVYREYESKESPYYENFRSLIQNNISFKKTGYFREMFKDAVACYKEKNRIPVSGISDGFDSIDIIDKIIKEANLI